MKKLIAMLLALALALCCCFAYAEDKPIIGIIQQMDHVALNAARDGFIQALADNGFVDGENITLDIQNGQGDQSNLSTIADRFVAEKAKLVLAIATTAATTMAGKTADIPILGTAITDYEAPKLVQSNEEPGWNISGTSDMNPVAAQIGLLKQLAPDCETVGVLYTSGEMNSVLQAGMASDDPVYLSTLRIDAAAFAAAHPEVELDADGVRVLRSVLMKPEHEPHVPWLHERVSGIAKR